MKNIMLLMGWLNITSCGVKTKLSEQDLQWVNYRSGDTLIFKGNKGSLDTIAIVEKSIYYPAYNPVEMHDKYLPQMATVKAKRIGMEEFTFVELEKRDPDRPAKWMMQIKDFGFFHDDIMEELTDINQSSFEGKFPKWRVSPSINAQSSLRSISHVNHLYLSGDYQIIAYEMSSGEVMIRIR